MSTLYCEGLRSTLETAKNAMGLTLFVPHRTPEKTGVKGGPTVGVCLFLKNVSKSLTPYSMTPFDPCFIIGNQGFTLFHHRNLSETQEE